jgi:hypothetical protein
MSPPANGVLRGSSFTYQGMKLSGHHPQEHAYILCYDLTDYIRLWKEQLGSDKSIHAGVGNGHDLAELKTDIDRII